MIPPLLPAQSDFSPKDSEHLRLLSVFHFVKAGLSLVGLVFLLLHYAMFSLFFSTPGMWENSGQGPPPEQIQEALGIFQWFYLVFGLWFALSGILNVLSGLFLRSRKHRTFSIIVAGVNCLNIPLGTILGVCTLIVLMRDSVRNAYRD